MVMETSRETSSLNTTGVVSRRNNWQDWANLVLAIWLFISPWVLRFAMASNATAGAAGTDFGHASWNAWVLGIIVFLVALGALTRMQVWEEWVNGLLAVWIFIAPWVLGFQHLPAAAWDHWIVGILVFLISLSVLTSPTAGRGSLYDLAHAHR